jgi:CBS domain-containing protein
MPQTTLVRDAMTRDVVMFGPNDKIETAARVMSEKSIGGAPVVDENGKLVGLLADDDLIVQDTRLHLPTVISVLGAYLELPSSVDRLESELRKAVGATVGDVMTRNPPVCHEDDTLETVATLMHEHNVARLPVVVGDHVAGIIARGDILRDIVRTAQSSD